VYRSPPDGTDKLLSHPKYRADIDGLRAVAVLSVVGYHAFAGSVPGGFIGVDVFFVISGFLISSILFENLQRGSFSFVEFYARRIRRIFPALLLVLTACYACGWMILLPDEFAQLCKHIAGGAGFVANFVLWGENGYFDGSAATKPLLHLWSLGIEEQYYIVWPLILWIAWKRRLNFLMVTLGLAVISFALNVVDVSTDLLAAFYSPQTRYWELLIGAALAYAALRGKLTPAGTAGAVSPAGTLAHASSLAGAALIGASVAVISEQRSFPGWWALLPTAGAALLVAAGPQGIVNRTVLCHRVMVWFGVISYPLYLWHWPLLSFVRIVENGFPSRPARTGAVLLAIVLAWLTYRLIEKPFRSGRAGHAKVVVLSVAMLSVLCLGLQGFAAGGLSFRRIARAAVELTEARRDWTYVAPSFDGRTIGNVNRFAGFSADSVLFVGDSTMAQYFPRLERLYSSVDRRPYLSAYYVARPGCRPVPNGEALNTKNFECDAYYRAVMRLAADPIYKKIVISANWTAILSPVSPAQNLQGLSADIGTLRALGKSIVLIALPPRSDIFDPLGMARSLRLHPFDDGKNWPQQLWVDESSLRARDLAVSKRTEELAQSVGATLIDPLGSLCVAGACPVIIDHKPLYMDEYHLRASTARQYATFMDRIVAGP
jgi:peptidoglycan/LPS O-acetylase OafA/YrhL